MLNGGTTLLCYIGYIGYIGYTGYIGFATEVLSWKSSGMLNGGTTVKRTAGWLIQLPQDITVLQKLNSREKILQSRL